MNKYLNSQSQHKTHQLNYEERQSLLLHILRRIRRFFCLKTILNTAVAEIRDFLAGDRVIIYRLDGNSGNQILFEAVGENQQSLKDDQIWEECFNANMLKLLEEDTIPQATANVYDPGLAKFHLSCISKFEVKTNLIIPIHINNQIWGFLIIHHCRDDWEWHPSEMIILEQLSVDIAIAIEHAILLEQAQESQQKTDRRTR
ncbi:MAG: GAF domain-containing protein [Sphaerospermopsis kisseleviana]